MMKVNKMHKNWSGCKLSAHLLIAASVALFAAINAASGGTLTVKFGTAMEVEIDGAVQSFAKNATFTPTAIPCLYRMRPVLAEGERTYAIRGSENSKEETNPNPYWRFPLPGEDKWVRVALDPYPAEDTTVTLTGYKTSSFYYVDADRGDDDWDGTTDYANRDEPNRKGPKKTLQAAHNVATDDSIVFAARGVYDTGVATNYNPSAGENPCIRRLISSKSNIGFIATEGPENTFIVGAPDPNGTNGMFGEESISGVYMSPSSGKSAFIQGFTITGCYSPASQVKYNQFGTAFCCGAHRSYCLDCVISNNYAVTSYPVSDYGIFERVRIFENETGASFLSKNGVFVSCIFAGNRIGNSNSTASNRAHHDNADTYFCTYDLKSTKDTSGRSRLESDSCNIHAALAYGLTTKSTTTTNATRWLCRSQAIDDPLFGNATARDYRLKLNSPARNVPSYADDLDGKSRMFATSDGDGRMPVLHDGRMSLGAMWNEMNTWYVTQNGGDDANDGTSPESAKATINAAIALSFHGDTIRVAPGTYGEAEGDRRTSANTSAGFRVIVPENITIESTEGAEKTFIVGAPAPAEYIDNAKYGTGTNAIRCVYARSGATVRGFTLTGGRGVGVSEGSNAGSAFYSQSARAATVEDCIISNNVAYNITINQAVVKNCRVIGNSTISDSKAGAAGTSCSWYGSIIDKNRGAGTLYNPMVIENCTFGAKNVNTNGSASQQWLFYSGEFTRSIVNSVILGGKLYTNKTTLYATNCLIAATDSSWQNKLPEERRSNVKFGSDAHATVDEAYRPVLGEFEGIDGGAECSPELGDRDAYGTPRILNGAIDIGAVEYDWRPVFAQRVGRRLTFTDVSPSVTTNAAGGLLIPSGVLAGKVAAGGPYAFTFEISGGTLEAFVGGVSAGVFPAAAGEQSVTLSIPDAETEFRLVFTPDAESPGSALLKTIASNKGIVISFM